MIRISALRGTIFLATLVLTIGCVTTGCSKTASKKTDVSVSSFRADPSKMTPTEKDKFNALMRNAQSAEKK